MDKESLVVDGFVFSSQREMQIALKEKKNIEIIRQRTPLHDGHAVYELYTKLVERSMFKTMIGYSFLAQLRYVLITEFDYPEEDLPTVELPRRMEYENVRSLNQTDLEKKVEHLLLIKKRLSILVFALSIMVVAMFVIAAINPNVGYINAEKKILNKYSAWQEELEQREEELREKENTLEMNH